MDIFEFFVEGPPPLSQQTRNPVRLREWKEYVRSEAAKVWRAQEPHEGTLKLTVVYYHERQSVLIDHDNMIKPIQDALAGLAYKNDRQITDAQTRKTNIDGRFRLRHLSPVYARACPKSRGTAMTPSIVNESERKRLERIAGDYRTQQYEVKVKPRADDLPDFLAGFEPDLVVSGKGETIVVEVKTRSEITSAPIAPALEAALQNRPGWRFELVIEGAGTDSPQTLNASQIRAVLEEATELDQRNHASAALLLLWSAGEAALRLFANRENVDLESFGPGYVVTRLYTLGLLGREQYQALDVAMRLRNQAAHGFQVSVTSKDLIGIFAVLRDLLNEVEAKAA